MVADLISLKQRLDALVVDAFAERPRGHAGSSGSSGSIGGATGSGPTGDAFRDALTRALEEAVNAKGDSSFAELLAAHAHDLLKGGGGGGGSGSEKLSEAEAEEKLTQVKGVVP